MGKKYNPYLSKHKQAKGEPGAVFVLRVFVCELPFSFIRTADSLAKVILLKPKSRHLFLTTATAITGIFILANFFLGMLYHTVFNGMELAFLFVLLGFLSELQRKKIPKAKGEEVIEQEPQEEEEVIEEAPQEEVKEIKEEEITKVDKEEEISTVAVSKEKVEEEKLDINTLGIDALDIDTLLGKESILSKDEQLKKTMSEDLGTMNLEQLLNTDWMNDFNQMQAKLCDSIE